MARSHRRSLHRRAARVAEQRLIGVSNLMDARRLWRIRVNHLLSGARSSGREASANSFSLMGKHNLFLLADTLEEAALNSQELGDYSEAISYRVWPSHLSIHGCDPAAAPFHVEKKCRVLLAAGGDRKGHPRP